MILNDTTQTLQTNMQTKSTSFGIGDVSTVIEILRNRLYSNPIQTLVQEYICNARDAMREAGTWGKQALVIGVPNAVLPVFKVRDYGVGLSPDRVEKVFVLYGASTKRNSNNQTGGFGIGAKSAWSYTDSFTVTTFVDGIKRVYVAHLGTNNIGSFDLLSEQPTTESNGTQIEVAVRPRDLMSFFDAIKRCTHYWKEPITFLGTTSLPNNDKRITYEDADVMIDTRSPYTSWESALLIDGVIYPWHNKNRMPLRSSFLLKFNTGEIDISASREEITKSEANNKAIDAKIMRLIAKGIELSTELKKLTTLSDVIKFQEQWGEFREVYEMTVDMDGYKYNNGILYANDKNPVVINKYVMKRKGISNSQVKSIMLTEELIIDDGILKQMDRARRIRAYASSKRSVLVVSEVPAPLAHNKYLKLSELPFIAATPKAKSTVSAEHVSLFNGSHTVKLTTGLDTSKKYCYATKADYDSYEADVAHRSGYLVLRVTLIGEKQVKKAIPNIETLDSVIEKFIDKNIVELAKITDSDKKNLLNIPTLKPLVAKYFPIDTSDTMNKARNAFIVNSKVDAARKANLSELSKVMYKFPLVTEVIRNRYNGSITHLIGELNDYVKFKQGDCKCK